MTCSAALESNFSPSQSQYFSVFNETQEKNLCSKRNIPRFRFHRFPQDNYINNVSRTHPSCECTPASLWVKNHSNPSDSGSSVRFSTEILLRGISRVPATIDHRPPGRRPRSCRLAENALHLPRERESRTRQPHAIRRCRVCKSEGRRGSFFIPSYTRARASDVATRSRTITDLINNRITHA